MNAKSIAMGVVAMVVATVLVVTCAVPIISDSVATEDTFKNEGYYNVAKATSDTDVTITWEKASPTIIKIGDGQIDMSTFAQNSYGYTIVGADNILVRYYATSSTITIHMFDSNGNFSNPNTGSSTIDRVSVTIANGTVTFTVNPDNEDPYTKSTTPNVFCYYMTPEKTDYVMKKANTSAYMLGDSEFTLIGVSVSAGRSGICQYGVGTIDDGVSMTNFYKYNITSVTYSDVTIDSTEKSGYNDLYELDKCSFTINYDDSTSNATYSYFIVPSEVTAERSVHVDGPTGDILAVIPILMVLGIVIGAVALFLTTRRD